MHCVADGSRGSRGLHCRADFHCYLTEKIRGRLRQRDVHLRKRFPFPQAQCLHFLDYAHYDVLLAVLVFEAQLFSDRNFIGKIPTRERFAHNSHSRRLLSIRSCEITPKNHGNAHGFKETRSDGIAIYVDFLLSFVSGTKMCCNTDPAPAAQHAESRKCCG